MPNSSLIDLKERPSLSIAIYLSNASRSCFLRIIKPQKFFVQTFGVTSTLTRLYKNSKILRFSDFQIQKYYFFKGSLILAAKNCLFILAMLVTEMPFGHSAIHAYVFEQLPNQSSSILATIFCTLS